MSEAKKLSMVAKLGARVEELESEAERLRDQVAWYEDEKRWGWTRHRDLAADDYPAELPVPRLQIEYRALDDAGSYSSCWRYELIYRHITGQLIAVPLGFTRTSAMPSEHQGPGIPQPFRDSSHLMNDAEQLGLPAFYVWGPKVEREGRKHPAGVRGDGSEARDFNLGELRTIWRGLTALFQAGGTSRKQGEKALALRDKVGAMLEQWNATVTAEDHTDGQSG